MICRRTINIPEIIIIVSVHGLISWKVDLEGKMSHPSAVLIKEIRINKF